MSRYWDGDDVWANPLPLQREGSDGGGLEHGSGAFDVMRCVVVGNMTVKLLTVRFSQLWPYLTASDTLDSVLGSANPAASSFHPSHVPATVPVFTSVRTVSPTYSHTLLHQTPNSAQSIDEKLQHILDQLGPNELVDSGTFGNIS
jgi:hypothetical protein